MPLGVTACWQHSCSSTVSWDHIHFNRSQWPWNVSECLRDLKSKLLEVSVPELRRWTQVGLNLVHLSHQVCSCRVFPWQWHFQLYSSPFSEILFSSSGKVLFCAALLWRNTSKGGESRGIQQSFPVWFPDAVPRVCWESFSGLYWTWKPVCGHGGDTQQMTE